MEYTPKGIDKQDLANRIKYHRPNAEAINAIAQMRAYAYEWGVAILDLVPEGREKALAITHLETALFWANAGIARESNNWDEEQPEK